jgi:hypothetical protein
VGFDVAVNRSLSVSIVERTGDRIKEAHRIAQTEGTLLLQDGVERATRDILHRDVVQALLLTDIVDGNDGWVVEVRCGRGFALKTLDELLIQTELRSQYLERYLALEERIYGSVNTSHTAAAQLGANLVAPDPAPGETSHAVHSFPSNLCLGHGSNEFGRLTGGSVPSAVLYATRTTT